MKIYKEMGVDEYESNKEEIKALEELTKEELITRYMYRLGKANQTIAILAVVCFIEAMTIVLLGAALMIN